MVRCVFLLTIGLAAAGQEADIRAVIQEQTAAWNRGDIDGFMKTYDASAQTAYVGSGGVTKGHDKVLARYKAKYATRAAMGNLRFSDLDVRLLDASFATVTGRFHLERTKEAGGNATGWFTLVLKKTPQGWRIIHDHTS